MILTPSHKIVAESATISTPSGTETIKVAATSPRQTSRLTEDQERMLRDLEVVFVSEGRVSLGAAKALHLIKENRLYLGHGGSMKKYGARWGYSSAYTSRLSKSGAVYFSLEPLWRDEGWPEPTSAWQLRPLSDLKKVAAQKATWRKAVRLSQGAAPTAAVVEECVAKLLGRAVSKPAKEFLI